MPVSTSQFLNKIRSKYPEYNNVDDARLLSGILKKYPEYRSQISDIQPTNTFFLDKLPKLPVPKLPEFARRGYNWSIAGLSQELITGKQPFDLSGYNVSTLETISAGITSVLLDSWAYIGGGIVGGIAGKEVLKQAVKVGAKTLIKSGVKRQVAKKVMLKAAESAGAFGVHSAIVSPLSQQLESGAVDPVKMGSDILKGSALGAIFGTTGALTAKMSGATRLGATISTFGIASPALEGRLPTKEDFIEATGMVIGLKGAHGIAKVGGRLRRKEPLLKPLKPFGTLKFDTKAQRIQFAKGRTAQIGEHKATHDIYKSDIDPSKKPIQITDIIPEKDGSPARIQFTENIITRRGETTGKESRKTKEMVAEDFFTEYYSGRLGRFKSPRTRNIALSKIIINKHLKWDRETELEHLKKYGVESTKDLTNFQLHEYRQGLSDRIVTKRFAKFLEIGEIRVKTMPVTGLLEDFVPKPLRFMVEKLKQSQDRFISKGSRILGTKIESGVKRQYRLQSDWIRDLEMMKMPDGGRFIDILGRGKKKKLKAENLYKLVEKGKWKDFNKLTEEIYNKARAAGVKVKPFKERYLTTMVKDDILEAIVRDLDGLGKKGVLDEIGGLKELRKTKGGNEAIDALVESLMAKFHTKGKFGFNEKTKEAIEFWMRARAKEGKKVTIVDAIEHLNQYNTKAFYKTDSFLEMEQRSDFPKNFYETDIRVLMHRYLTDASRRIAFAKEFGASGKTAKALFDMAKREGKGDVKLMDTVYRAATGAAGIDPPSRYSPTTQHFFEKIIALNVAFKISTGFATIPNLTQSIISIIPALGLTPFLKGVGSMAYEFSKEISQKGYISPKLERIRRSGALSMSLYDELLSYAGKGKTAQFARAMGIISFFKGVNKLNQFMSASVAEVGIKAMHGKAKNNVRLQRKLEMMGVDYKKPLTETVIKEAMRQFAFDSQLQKNVLRDIEWMNDPKVRPFLLFKSFGLRQYQFMKDIMKFELSHGNFLPLIRLAALGYFGGAFVDKARHWLKEKMAGEDIYNEDKEGIEEFIDYIAQVGAFGMLTDIISAESTFQSLRFAATPVILSDLETMFKAFIKLEEDTSDYGILGAMRRAPKGFAPLAGTAGRVSTKAIEPKGQKERGTKSFRNRVINKIKKDMSNGKYELAIKNIRLWNKANRLYPIDLDDINPKKIYEYILRKKEKRLSP